MKKRTWLTVLPAPAILAVALLASNGHPVHLTRMSPTAYTSFLANSGNGGGGGGGGNGSSCPDGLNDCLPPTSPCDVPISEGCIGVNS